MTICKNCGKQFENNGRRFFCGIACYQQYYKKIFSKTGKQIRKQKKYEQLYYSSQNMQDFYQDWRNELEKRKKINDTLSQFNSVTGISETEKESRCILYTDNEAEQIGLQPIFSGGILYWNPANKALYVKHNNIYYAVTSEV